MATLAHKRRLAFHKQHGRCIYCGAAMWLQSPSELQGINARSARLLQATAEHKRARCDGGTNSRLNIAAACRYCNSHRHRAKCPRSFEDQRKLVQRRLVAGKWHGLVTQALWRGES